MWQRILVPHDFSPSANHAAALARDEAKAHGGEIILLHVVDLPIAYGPDTALILPGPNDTAPVGMREYALRSATDHLQDLATRLAHDGVDVSTFVVAGRPVDEIVRFAREHEADVIVMGTHGRTGIRHLFAGSVAERVVRSSHVPVMTIRQQDEPRAAAR
jgi:nucleotide-binding universal stress UspA family protein